MEKFAIAAVMLLAVGIHGAPLPAAAGGAVSEDPDGSAAANGQQQQMPVPTVPREHLFEERAGTWKATCDEMEDRQVYCRMFHIEQFGEWKTKNFVQFGPAFSPEAAGFVIATYLGFKEGTTVTIGIDKHSRHKITASKGNNLMIGPEVTDTILGQMENGNKIVITFNSHSGVRHLSLAELEPFQRLLAKVKRQLANNDQSANAQ
jgi:invasion protein IalB